MIRVIGHRGAAALEPENTLRSIRKAIELGVDQVEIDVRVTKDGHLALMHDERVDRTTNGHGYVRDLTLEELRKLDAGRGERIPTLEEVLKLTLGKVILQIELKAEEATEPVVHLVEALDAGKDVVITSFVHELLARTHELNPNLRTGALFFNYKGDLCQKAITVHSRSLHVYYRDVDSRLVEDARRRGLKIQVWNPDSEEDMARMIELEVDGIGTNRPDVLLNLLRSKKMR